MKIFNALVAAVLVALPIAAFAEDVPRPLDPSSQTTADGTAEVMTIPTKDGSTLVARIANYKARLGGQERTLSASSFSIAAESSRQSVPRVAEGVRGSVDRLARSPIPQGAFTQAPAPASTPQHKGRSGARKLLGGVLGAAVGVVVGFAVGSNLEPPCGCDDPGLTWGVYGAGIGLVGGATAGAILASR